jgi:deazaflavin-dependent oxidoreductase (nitroreductase family)
MKGISMFLWKLSTALYVWLYRLSKGRLGGSMADFNVLLLTTTGRKTGLKHTVPLGYVMDKDAYVVVGLNSGKENQPAWFLNLGTNSQAEIQVKDKVMAVHAETAQGEYRQQLWEQVKREAPSYRNYEGKTKRELPIIVLRS